jgi:hypothetical protein
MRTDAVYEVRQRKGRKSGLRCLLELQRDAAADKENLISAGGDALIAAACQVAETAGGRIVRDYAQAHFVGNHDDLALMAAGGCAELVCQKCHPVFGEFLAALLGLVHQIADPQGQTVNKHGFPVWTAAQQLGDTKRLLNSLPVPACPIAAVPADALIHFRITIWAGGQEQLGRMNRFSKLLGKGGFAGAAAAGDKGERGHLVTKVKKICSSEKKEV